MQLYAIDVVRILQKKGFKAYYAGGCVRDMIMGIYPKDIDIATDATPDQIENMFACCVSVGKKFGVILVKHKKYIFEVATFRSDADYSDGRHPDAVTFTSPEEDAKRRDFTINGMFYDPVADQYLDFVGGQKDLKERLIRFIGNPEKRIEEDHLRLLRAIRFKNQFHFQYDPETYDAIKSHSHLILQKVSGERIREEICKMLLYSPKPSTAFTDMSNLGILDLIIPELEQLKGMAQPYEYHQEGDVWNHTMGAIDSLPVEAPLIARLATLFHDIGKAYTYSRKERIRFDSHAPTGAEVTEQIMKRLKFSKNQIEAVTWCIKYHMNMMDFLKMKDKKLRQWLHHPQMENLLILMKADAEGTIPTDLSLYKKIERLYRLNLRKTPKPPKPFLSGIEIIELTGLSPGPKVGKIKEKLLDLQIIKKIKSKKSAQKWVKEKYLSTN